MSTQKMIREMRKLGWHGALTKGGHVAFRHPGTSHVIISGATPGDRRVERKLRVLARKHTPKETNP